jgi:hypothetical protein
MYEVTTTNIESHCWKISGVSSADQCICAYFPAILEWTEVVRPTNHCVLPDLAMGHWARKGQPFLIFQPQRP